MAARQGGRRAARALARAPVGLFRAGWGGLLGHRFLMLEHVGRRTGVPRHVVLEVVAHLPEARYVVASGMGENADWYRNVRHDPRVHVSIGRRHRAPATARLLDRSEARARLGEYRAERPVTWRMLGFLVARLTGRPGQPDDVLFSGLRLVELALDRGD